MATNQPLIYIRDKQGQEFLTNQLKISSGRIVLPDVIQDNLESIGAEGVQAEIELNNIDINSAPGMLLSSNVINAITQYIETTIQSFIADNAEDVLAKLGLNQNVLEITNHILDIVDSATFKINSILKFVPTNIKMIPSFGEITSSICTSLKDMYMAIWLNLQEQYYKTINYSITNLPSAQEALKESLQALQDIAENVISEQCYRYTGKTLVELRYMCQSVISKYKQYKERVRKARQGIDEYTQTIIDFNLDVYKNAFKEELNNCSDVVYNAFMILEIKESIENIMQLVNEFNNIDLKSLADGMNTFQDFMDLLVELGIDEQSNILTLKDAIKTGFNTIKNNFDGLTAQLTAQALNSATQLTLAAVNNTSINQQKVIIQNYSFDLDIDTNTLFIIFEKEPTTKHIIKNLTSALRQAENSNKEKVFNSNQIQLILNLINKGVFEKQDQELNVGVFNVKLKFNIDGYNVNVQEETNQEQVQQTQDKSLYGKVSTIINTTLEDYYQRLDEIKAARDQEIQEAFQEFNLGVITEEYSEDPNLIKKRPTLQLVHELFSILKEIFPLLKIVITLVSNYKINKEKVKNNAQGNLFSMIKFLAKVNNLLQSLNKSEKNFYAVRTLKTYHFINENIKPIAFDIIGMELNNEETQTLYNYLILNKLDTTDISTALNTILYFDMESINEQDEEYKESIDSATGYFGDDTSLFIKYPDSKYKDGTTIGLDKIQIAGNYVYYSDSSLPIIGSQIMRAYSRNLDVSF